MKRGLDCLFIHTGRFSRGRWDMTLMPAGLFALADVLQGRNIRSQMLNFSLAKMKNPRFPLNDFIRTSGASIICMPLHWHQQSGDVISLARSIKSRFPSKKIILGGITASCFAGEILRDFHEVDFIIRGEAEKPLPMLVERLLSGANTCDDIPNLVRRRGTKIVANSGKYVASKDAFENLCFTNLDLVFDSDGYISESRRLENVDFSYVPGRGCLHDCSLCGGGARSHKIISDRKQLVCKSPRAVAQDFERLRSRGISSVAIAFDPFENSRYYTAVFRELKRKKILLRVRFESFGLPAKKFLEKFKETFAPGSGICISPDTGSDDVRKRNKGRFYDNESLLGTLELMSRMNIAVRVCFTSGLPFETREDFFKTAALIEYLQGKLKIKNIGVAPVPLEPCSPAFLNPRKFHVKLRRKRFADFMRQKGGYDLGYSTDEFSEREIVKNIKYLQRLVHGGNAKKLH